MYIVDLRLPFEILTGCSTRKNAIVLLTVCRQCDECWVLINAWWCLCVCVSLCLCVCVCVKKPNIAMQMRLRAVLCERLLGY